MAPSASPINLAPAPARGDRGTTLWLLGITLVAAAVGAVMVLQSAPPSSIAWCLFAAAILAVFYQPRWGVYLIIGLTLAGDPLIMPWYPFYKNMSSPESALFLNRSVIFSPLETLLVLTLLAWAAQQISRGKFTVHRGPLLLPLLAFTGFMAFGLANGLTRGGNVNIALWESRAIFYVVVLVLLITNLIERRAHVGALLAWLVTAVALKGLAGSWYTASELQFNLVGYEAIAAHHYSIQINALLLLIPLALLYKTGNGRRLLLLSIAPLTIIGYLANQRRAGYIALALALVLFAVVLYREHRKAFWLVVPLVGLLAVGYLAAFWNASGAIGSPARAIRSVIAPSTASVRDQASNIYRVLENINIMFTIKTAPLTGVGFGKKFYIIAPMADISFFEWWEYITHNSIMWVWMQTGVGGFITMVYLVLLTIATGFRVIWRMPGGTLGVAAALSTCMVVMHFLYAYVDISWEAQGMIFVATAIGLINTLERVAATPEPAPAPRYRWQRAPAAPPLLREEA